MLTSSNDIYWIYTPWNILFNSGFNLHVVDANIFLSTKYLDRFDFDKTKKNAYKLKPDGLFSTVHYRLVTFEVKN